jgi:hypothetical protein
MADREAEEARFRGEQVTRCHICGQLIADPLLWGHEERHARTAAQPNTETSPDPSGAAQRPEITDTQETAP